jgi:hypothetical protein
VLTYRIRWTWAVATSATLPAVLGLATAVLIRPTWVGCVVGIALTVALTAPSLRRVRRRTLTVSDAGLEVQRDSYAMRVGWDQVVGVRQRRHQRLIPVDELVLSGSDLIPRSSTGKANTLPASLPAHPAARRIQVSLYNKAWRDGPIGNHLQGVVHTR